MSDNPATKITTGQIIAKLPSRFQSDQAKDMQAVFQFKLSNQLSFYIEINDQKCTIVMQEHEDPNITLIMDEDTFVALMLGEIDGMSAFMKGSLKAQGNVILATSLGKLFKKRTGDNQKLSS
ncbi:MAG: SCP2 sterol-binding domain-containing protein [Oceanospirillaceae bacterium]